MIRQLIIPGIIAGALHGGLLLIPNTPVPPLPKVMAVVIDDKWPTLPVVPPEIEPTKCELGQERPEIRPVSMMPQNLVVPVDNAWTTPFVPDPPGLNVDPTAMSVPLGDIMKLGTGHGTDGFTNLIDSKFLDKTPRTVFQMAPDYPSGAKHDGIQGTVTVMFTVDENGNVHDARIADSTDNVFNEAALRAVSRWRFEPGLLHGKRVAFKMSVPITFTLNEGE